MKKKILFVIVILVAIVAGVCFFLCSGHNQGEKPSDNQNGSEESIIDRLRNSCVMVTVDNYHGSGVIIGKNEDRILIVTAAHLVEGFEQGIISFNKGKTGFADIIGIYPDEDLAYLYMDCDNLDTDLCDSIVAAQIDVSALQETVFEEQVYLIGSSINTNTNVCVAKILSTDYFVPDFGMNMLYLSADVSAGMSGCACFDSEGKLLGIVVGGSEASEAVAVPITIIEEMKEGK